MSMSEEQVKNWQELQKQYAYPVNPHGKRIEEGDAEFTLWEDLGLYAYMKS